MIRLVKKTKEIVPKIHLKLKGQIIYNNCRAYTYSMAANKTYSASSDE